MAAVYLEDTVITVPRLCQAILILSASRITLKHLFAGLQLMYLHVSRAHQGLLRVGIVLGCLSLALRMRLEMQGCNLFGPMSQGRERP